MMGIEERSEGDRRKVSSQTSHPKALSKFCATSGRDEGFLIKNIYPQPFQRLFVHFSDLLIGDDYIVAKYTVLFKAKPRPGYTCSAQYHTRTWCDKVKSGQEEKYPRGCPATKQTEDRGVRTHGTSNMLYASADETTLDANDLSKQYCITSKRSNNNNGHRSVADFKSKL